MDWARAKNLSITAFIILNILIGFLNYLDSRRYILGADSIAAITSVLETREIKIDRNFEFISNEPLRQISFESQNINRNFLVGVLMQNNTNMSVQEDEEFTRFFNEAEEVVFGGQTNVRYRNISNFDLYFSSLQEARIFAADMIVRLGDIGRYFVLDRSYSYDDTMVLMYRDMYRNNTIYSNALIFVFREGRIETIDFNYDRVIGFSGNPREIRRADEVMLTFARHVESDVVVREMDIVYKNINNIGTPHYRIIYERDGQFSSVLINAYTNIITNG